METASGNTLATEGSPCSAELCALLAAAATWSSADGPPWCLFCCLAAAEIGLTLPSRPEPSRRTWSYLMVNCVFPNLLMLWKRGGEAESCKMLLRPETWPFMMPRLAVVVSFGQPRGPGRVGSP